MVGLVLAVAIARAGFCETPVLNIAADRVIARISPLHAGLMTEEINHAYDGGLYAELVANRAFQDDISPVDATPPRWHLVQDGNSAAAMQVDDRAPLNAVLGSSLRLEAIATSAGNRVGVANEGFWGMPVRASTAYRASFYARHAGAGSVPIKVSLESLDGTVEYAHASVEVRSGDWRRYELPLLTTADSATTAHARLVLSTEQTGTLWFDLVSLFPPTYHERENGNRIDLMERLAALRPAFLRFPGGNYLEGDTLATHWDWKATLGPMSERPTHEGPWRYHVSDGLGLLEFLHWCEDLKMEPVLGLFAGNSLSGEFAKPGAELAPYVQDALDELQYVTGNVETPWGARRAQDGHPAPFRLTYVEIGNEDWTPASDYEGRFAQFFDAIKARYPGLQLIATTPVRSRIPDVLDEHYYRSAQKFFEDVHHYDRADRHGPKIFVGEWATMEGEPTPNLNAALGDAAWMIGMERNADLVVMQAYAPLLANVNPGAYQWRTNLIGYDALTSYGSPSYYAQVMFNSHRGDVVLQSSPGVAPGLFESVTRDTPGGRIYVKVVNALGVDQNIRIQIAGLKALYPTGEQTILSGDPSDTNTLLEPEAVVPRTSILSGVGHSFEHLFPARSITVLELRLRSAPH
jgi:alpha-N-arabinofuranosidase